MDPRKLDKEMLAKLPPELQKDIKDGNVVAISMARPAMSSMFFSAALAIVLFLMALPLFAPVTALMVVGNGLGMLGWFLSYAIADRLSCRWQNKFRLANGLLEGISIQLEKSLQKQQDTDGTKSESVCLKEGSTGSDEVQGDGK